MPANFRCLSHEQRCLNDFWENLFFPLTYFRNTIENLKSQRKNLNKFDGNAKVKSNTASDTVKYQ